MQSCSRLHHNTAGNRFQGGEPTDGEAVISDRSNFLRHFHSGVVTGSNVMFGSARFESPTLDLNADVRSVRARILRVERLLF